MQDDQTRISKRENKKNKNYSYLESTIKLQSLSIGLERLLERFGQDNRNSWNDLEMEAERESLSSF